MKAKVKTKRELMMEIEELQERLKEAEEKLTTYQKNETTPLPAQKLARSILDQSTEVIIICDENGRIIQTSQVAHRFFNRKLLGQLFDSICPLSITSPSPLTPTQFSISSVLSGKIIRSLEVTHRHDGQVSYFLLSARPLSDGENFIGCLITLTDVTEHKKMEEQIAHLASFPQLNPNPITEIDASGNIYYLNPSAERLFPELRSAGTKHPWFKDFESLAPMFRTWQNISHAREIEIDKNWYYQSFLYTPEWDRILIYGLDITERKRMEEALRTSRDELEIRVQERTKEAREHSRVLDSFFKFSITPFVILDKDFNFIRVNEAYAKACHREVSEFPGHNHFEFYPSDARAKFQRVVQTKEPYVAIAKPFTFPDHSEWGTTYWDWTLTPILDEAGETEFLVFSLEDVTKRKRADEAIKGERQRFYDVLEMLPAYLVLLTQDYHVPFANCFFRERFGESHGNRCFEYLFGRSEPCEICETYSVLKTMAPHRWEWTGPDGRTYDVFDFPFTDTDGSTLILEMGIDITERKRAEEALRESEKRLRTLSTQLLTTQEGERKRIAMELHDGIGQMLTAIKFKTESILQEKERTRTKDESLKAIIQLIKETIEEVRRMQMDLRPSTLDDLGVLATLGWFCREYQKVYSRIRIEKEIAIQESEVSTPLKVVLYRLTQEAMNNIAKHSQADLVRLSLRRQENEIEWTIEDNGMGFDLEKTLSSEGSKRGLGLSSMRERIQISGGTFVIESTQGKGTTIRAIWPV